MKSILTRLFVASLCLGVSLASQAQEKKVIEVAEKPVIPFAQGAKGHTVALTKLRTKFATPPAYIGMIRYGADCKEKFYIGWDRAVYAQYTKGMGEILRDELKKAHYPVPPSPSVAQLHIGAYIEEVQVDHCSKNAVVSRDEKGRKQASVKNLDGTVYVKIVWQVISPDGPRVIFETTTEGSYRSDAEIQSSPAAFFRKAYGVAVRNLLAERDFQAVILAK